MPVLGALRSADEAVPGMVQELRWGALTAVMSVLSAWWVTGVVMAALGGAAELRPSRA